MAASIDQCGTLPKGKSGTHMTAQDRQDYYDKAKQQQTDKGWGSLWLDIPKLPDHVSTPILSRLQAETIVPTTAATTATERIARANAEAQNNNIRMANLRVRVAMRTRLQQSLHQQAMQFFKACLLYTSPSPRDS